MIIMIMIWKCKKNTLSHFYKKDPCWNRYSYYEWNSNCAYYAYLFWNILNVYCVPYLNFVFIIWCFIHNNNTIILNNFSFTRFVDSQQLKVIPTAKTHFTVALYVVQWYMHFLVTVHLFNLTSRVIGSTLCITWIFNQKTILFL